MMERSLLVAGFGGQGVMTIGQMVGLAAAYSGKNATYFPSYGPEQRGGTANCTVVISDDEIGSPIVQQADIVIVMNEPSLVKFEGSVKPGGTLLVNSTLVESKAGRSDISVKYIPASEIADRIGASKAANMVMLGACMKVLPLVPMEQLEDALKTKARTPEKYELNKRALQEGMGL